MKIFSSFDTRFKTNALQEQQQKHGNQNIHLLEKSEFFFYKKIIVPIVSTIFFTIILWYVLSEYLQISPIINIVVMSIITIMWIVYAAIFKYYIDYKMDYCIVTPHEIILTEQSWIFKRHIRSLDVSKIKSISVQKASIVHWLFNNGYIIFMSDGDDNHWEITLEYIHNPEKQKWILNNIMMREW
jgi:hypothetical protein